MKPMFLFLLLFTTVQFSVAENPIPREEFQFEIGTKAIRVPDNREVRSLLACRNSVQLIRVLALVSESFNEQNLAGSGWSLISRKKSIVTLQGPLELITVLKRVEGVVEYEKPNRVISLMDQARTSSQVDMVHTTYSSETGTDIKGKGVLIGIIDTEFDLNHPSFLDKDGKSRFVALWDFYPERGAPYPAAAKDPKRVPFGAAIYGEELNTYREFGSGSQLHGTHVAGIAAGSVDGSGYHGVAPEARLIGVKYFEDPELLDTIGNPYTRTYPAHSGDIAKAVSWIFKVADSLKIPCVINTSLGSALGPHDGTSLYDQFVDNTVGNGKIIVGSSGNFTATKSHGECTLTPNDTTGTWVDHMEYNKDISLNKGNYINFEVWGENGSVFETQIVVKNEITGKNIKSSFISSQITKEYEPDTTVWNGDSIFFYTDVKSRSELNGKPTMSISAVGTNSKFKFAVRFIGKGTLNLWNEAYKGFHRNNTTNFFDGDSRSTIAEICGTGKSLISVGASTTKSSFTDYNGNTYDMGDEVGDIASFSSCGPTIDDRIKPDITAPGKMIVAPFCQKTPETYSSSVVSWHQQKYRYGAMQGTSMSSPFAAGAVALMLQVNPNLGPEEVKAILKETATSDAYTGTVPNNTWGVGKLNTLAAVKRAKELSSETSLSGTHGQVASFSPMQIIVRGNKLHFSNEHLSPKAVVHIYNSLGRLIKTQPIKNGVVSLSDLPSSVYFARVMTGGQIVCTQKIALCK